MERNILRIIKTFSSIPKFALLTGLFSLFFNIPKLIMRKLNFNLSPQKEGFICGLFSSLALLFATPGEVSIIKLVIYPRVIECIFEILCEKGILKKFKHGDIFGYAL